MEQAMKELLMVLKTLPPEQIGNFIKSLIMELPDNVAQQVLSIITETNTMKEGDTMMQDKKDMGTPSMSKELDPKSVAMNMDLNGFL
jgi:hypothetical protein